MFNANSYRITAKGGYKKLNIKKNFNNLPKELMVVKDYISIVGSTAKGKENPADLDILIRSLADDNFENYLIQSENIWLPVRNALGKEENIHLIPNPQGPHGDFISCYDLVLRRKEECKREIVKAASEMPGWEKYLEDIPSGSKIDLGCGESKPDGFLGVDREMTKGVNTVADLNYGIPFPDNSISIARANHVLEHLADKEQIMSEIYRVLAPGGKAIITVPDAQSPGAMAHPGHKTFWNKESFYFWSNPEFTEDRCIFKILYLKKREIGDLSYIDTVLQKPLQKAIEPFKNFEPPKPSMVEFTEAFDINKLIEWAKRKDAL
jgi:SAM-dependent methyltransferase